jgi:dipeptidyl-peptidase-4
MIYMKNWLAFIALLLSVSFTSAQNKLLTIEEAMLNARTTLAPDNMRQLQFIKGSSEYVYLKKVDGTDTWLKASFNQPQETPLINLSQLNRALRQSSLDTTSAMPAIQFSTDKWIMTVAGRKLSYNPASGTINVLLEKEILSKDNLDQSSQGYLAYLEKDNLFAGKPGQVKQVTTDGSTDIAYASSVHQSEFGITKGTFWSNRGNKLAFYRMDQHMVPDYPIIDWSERPAKDKPIRYPMAGDSSHHVTIGVYDADREMTIWLQTGEPKEQYLTNIAWSPDDRYIFVAVVNRGQNHMWLNQYDASSGQFLHTLFEEVHDKYVEPLVPMLFLKNNPSQFIWQSRRDGWNHLYLYDITGKQIRQLTSGKWEVTEVKGFDAKGNVLFYTSTEISPVSRSLSVLDLKKMTSRNLTPEAGVHNTQVSADGEWVIDNFSNTSLPRQIRLIPVKRPLIQKPRVLLTASDPLAAYAKGEISVFTRPNGQGTDLYYRVYKPVGFDSTKKYPVVVYWYGGPHAQLILNAWNGGAGDYWFQYMAEQGYLVMTIDTRGSSNRGREFEQQIFRMAGKAQMEDLMSAVDYLKSLPYADKERMGLFGWSYGGYMTTNMMLTHPEVFKTAVAGGPVMDWKYYEIMYTERYMDKPQENPEGYEAANMVKQAGKLKGKLLLIHGLQDPVVVQQHSVMFVRSAIDKGVQVDYMIYPGHEHNVLGKDRAHLYRKVTEYLKQNL